MSAGSALMGTVLQPLAEIDVRAKDYGQAPVPPQIQFRYLENLRNCTIQYRLLEEGPGVAAFGRRAIAFVRVFAGRRTSWMEDALCRSLKHGVSPAEWAC